MMRTPMYLKNVRFNSAAAKQWEEWEAYLTELENRFRRDFEALVLSGEQFELPAVYTASERKVGHRVAEEMRLKSESIGSGSEWRLRVGPVVPSSSGRP